MSDKSIVWKNWAGNLRCSPKSFHQPATLDEIRQLVRNITKAGERLRVAGGGHSWSPLVWNDDNLVSLDNFNRVIDVDDQAQTITVEGGIRLGQLNLALENHGLALPNLGTIDKQSFAGAISTGTHGTGIKHGILSTQVKALDLVTGSGDVLSCSTEENQDVFSAALCSLGSLGIISRVTIQCRPAFRLYTEEFKEPLSYVLTNLEALIQNNDHFSFYWMPYTDICLILTRNETADPVRRPKLPTLFDHYVAKNFAFDAVCRLGAIFQPQIPSFNRLLTYLAPRRQAHVDRSFCAFNIPVLIKHWESEYSIPVESTINVIKGLKHLIESQGQPVNMFLEFRFVKGDDIWLSPAYGRDSCYVDGFQYQHLNHDNYFRSLNDLYDDYSARPHWGKIHYKDYRAFRELYPRWGDFLQIREQLDPGRMFTNDYLDQLFGDQFDS
jgi:L-gulonolactone oxidase